MYTKYPFYYYLFLLLALILAIVFWYRLFTSHIAVLHQPEVLPHVETLAPADTTRSVGSSSQFAI